MARSLQSVPVLLDDGKRVRNLRVAQLVSALTALGVPTDTIPKLRADKVALLTTILSKSRAAVGQFGALEDGRAINDLSVDDVRAELVARGGDPAQQGCQRSELQRIVRVLTNLRVLASAPTIVLGAPVPLQPLAADEGAAASAPLAVAPLPVTHAGANQAFATRAGATLPDATQAAQGAPAPAAPTNAPSAARRPFTLPAQRSTFTVVPAHLSPPPAPRTRSSAPTRPWKSRLVAPSWASSHIARISLTTMVSSVCFARNSYWLLPCTLIMVNMLLSEPPLRSTPLTESRIYWRLVCST